MNRRVGRVEGLSLDIGESKNQGSKELKVESLRMTMGFNLERKAWAWVLRE